MDDSIEGNVSTFAAEMREMALILRNVERNSMSVKCIGSFQSLTCKLIDESNIGSSSTSSVEEPALEMVSQLL